MKRNVALLFVLAFAILAVNLWRGVSSSDADSARPETPSTAAPAASRETAEQRSEAPAQVEVTAAAEAAARGEAEARVTLRGAYRLRERDGAERDVRTGSFELVGYSSEGTQVLRGSAGAENGAWAFEIERDTLGRIVSFVVELPQAEGRMLPIVRTTEDRRIANDGKGFDVLLRDPQPCTLRVFDAATRVELSSIEVCKASGGLQHEEQHDRFVLGRDLASPIDALALRGPNEREILLTLGVTVRAPGYAWQEVQLDRGQGGERRVELFPGGDVEFRFTGESVPKSASLWISAPARAGSGDPVHFDLPVRGRSSFVLSGLRELDYEAVLHVGELLDPSARLASARFRVVAGQRTPVPVEVPRAPEIVRAGLSGIALIPPAYSLSASGKIVVHSQIGNRIGDQPSRLELKGVWEPATTFGRNLPVLRFEAAELALGTYVLAVEGTGFSRKVELPPEGLHGLRLELGPACEVIFDVVDASTGERVPKVELHWCVPEDDEEIGMTEWVRASRDMDELYRAMVPVGLLRWTVSADGYGEPAESSARLGGERNEIQLRLPRQCAVEFELLDGDARVQFPRSWIPQVEAVGHDGQLARYSFGSTTRVIGVTRPGLYRITLPSLNGYRRIEPRDIDLAPGERKLVRIDLERN